MAYLDKVLSGCHAQDEVAIGQGCDEVLDRVICDIIAARVQHLAEACGDVFGQLARLSAEGGCTLVVGHKDCRSLQHENRNVHPSATGLNSVIWCACLIADLASQQYACTVTHVRQVWYNSATAACKAIVGGGATMRDIIHMETHSNGQHSRSSLYVNTCGTNW